MGIIIAKVFDKKAKEPATPDFILPNEEQRAMIKKTWEVPKKNLMDSSEVIFYRYLEMFPHNQDSFDAFRNIPLITLKVGRVSGLILQLLKLQSFRAHQAFAPTHFAS